MAFLHGDGILGWAKEAVMAVDAVGDVAVGGLRVLRKLAPTTGGACKLARRYGEALVCVRHRVDAQARLRYAKVELLDEVTPIQARSERVVGLRVGARERDVQAMLRAAGAPLGCRG
ncbi:MAG: hypothetical protein ACK4F7_02465 [Inhella sp.]